MLSNGWTDWHQLWFTSADSSENGHRLNTSHPSIPQGGCRGGGLGGHTFKSLGIPGSCQTVEPIGTKFGTRLWIHLGMDIAQTISPTIPHCGWFYGINNSKDWKIVVKRLVGLGINFAHNADESGNEQGLNKLAP